MAGSSREQRSKEMWTPQTILPIGDPPPPLAALKANFADYALGWGLRDYHGRKLVGHTGGVGGFVSRVMLVPEENLGVVVLTNAEEDGAFDSILYHVLDHYFHLPPTDWIAAYKAVKDKEENDASETMKKAEGARAANSKPSLPLEKYAGVYNDAWYGPITIRMNNENGGLVITFDHTPTMIGDLQHWQYDTFKAHWRTRTIEDAFITFALNPDGTDRQRKNGRRLSPGRFQLRLSGPAAETGRSAGEEVKQVWAAVIWVAPLLASFARSGDFDFVFSSKSTCPPQTTRLSLRRSRSPGSQRRSCAANSASAI